MDQITLVQAPVIKHALKVAGEKVTERLVGLDLDKQLATEDTIKGLKDLRAELNIELTNYEAQRKFLKEGILNPYNEFENTYKYEIADKYKSAIDILKTKIDSVETEIKTRKRDSLIEYFNELCGSETLEFVSWNHLNLDINLSTTEKKYKEQINDFISRIKDDVALINASEFPAESMAEYKTSLNASRAITTIKERHERIRLEEERIKRERSQKRRTALASMGMVSNPITKTFNYFNDDNIFVSWDSVETMDSAQWSNITDDLGVRISMITETSPNDAPMAPLPSPMPVAQPPVAKEATTPKAEIFTATFEVTGTMAELKSLGAYMRANNINYINI